MSSEGAGDSRFRSLSRPNGEIQVPGRENLRIWSL